LCIFSIAFCSESFTEKIVWTDKKCLELEKAKDYICFSEIAYKDVIS